VKRADFDKLLLDNSRRCGATVQEEVRVTDIALMPGARAKVTGLDPDGTIGVWLPRFVVDATGRDTLPGRAANLSSLVANVGKAIELGELEARLALVEHQLGAPKRTAP
jgi:hypothetical protein